MRVLAVLVGVAVTASAWADMAGRGLDVVLRSNVLGFKLMQEAVRNEKQSRNLMVSPISSHFALSMALNGTSGATRDQFFRTLGYQTSDITTLNRENLLLLAVLNRAPMSPESTQPFQKSAPVLSIQNSVWSTDGKTDSRKYEFRDSFVKDLMGYYHVGLPQSLDFRDKGSADVINAWTEKATNGMIPEIIDAASLSDLLWILLNTTYLEARWQDPFDEAIMSDFTLADGEKVQVPLMRRAGHGRFMANSDMQVAEIVMMNSKLKAYVVLPQRPEVFSSMQVIDGGIWSQGTWASILGQLRPVYGLLTMPKFAFDSSVTLRRDQALTKAMDLNFLFQSSADFSNMDGENSPRSQVGIVKQNTRIEWNELGIKASAATMIGGVGAGFPPPLQINMRVDRPFYFAVYDEDTKTFFFLGQVTDPRGK